MPEAWLYFSDLYRTNVGHSYKKALLRPFARTTTKVVTMLSLEKNYVPSTTNECYIATAEFKGNTLTPN